VAAGLFSKAVWAFEANAWNKIVGGDADEVGSGPGSYNIRQSVWHVNCCNPELNGGGGWGIFNAILGWQNSATYGSVIAYNAYWIAVIVAVFAIRYYEVRGHWPLMKPSKAKSIGESSVGDETTNASQAVVELEKKEGVEVHTAPVREIHDS
jgi:high-affinity iron transporter